MQSIEDTNSPFVEQIDLPGTLSSADALTKALHIRLRYSPIDEGRSHGVALGGPDCEHELFPLFGKNPLRLQGVRTSSRERVDLPSRDREVFSSSVYLERGNASPSETIIEQVLGQFWLQDLYIRQRHTSRRRTRWITFLLGRQTTLWDAFRYRDWKPSREFREPTGPLPLIGYPHFKVSVSQVRFPAGMPTDRAKRIEAYTTALTIETTVSRAIIADQTFVDETRKLTDDVMLIMSMLTHFRNDWYGYHMYCSRYDERFLAGRGEGVVYPDRWMQHFPLLEPARAVDLLSTGVHEFQQRKQEGENLELPIKLFLASFESKFIEEQFLGLFFALERLIGLESDSRAIIPTRLFRPIAAEVRTAIEKACEKAKADIRQACGCEDIISMLLEKIGRPRQAESTKLRDATGRPGSSEIRHGHRSIPKREGATTGARGKDHSQENWMWHDRCHPV